MKSIYGNKQHILLSFSRELEAMRNSRDSLFSLVMSNQLEAFNRCISQGADINVRDGLERNLLMVAVVKGHDRMIDAIMSYKVININDTDYNGNNALMMAVKKNNLNIVQKLITLGINTSHMPTIGVKELISLNTHIPSKINALMEASMRGYLDIVKLLANKSDANALDENGNNALMLAAKSGRADIVFYLSNVTDINNQNSSGYTALMLGVITNSIEVVNVLLKLSANIHIKSYNGNDALMIASCKGQADIVSLLTTAKADIFADMDNVDNIENLGMIGDVAEYS